LKKGTGKDESIKSPSFAISLLLSGEINANRDDASGGDTSRIGGGDDNVIDVASRNESTGVGVIKLSISIVSDSEIADEGVGVATDNLDVDILFGSKVWDIPLHCCGFVHLPHVFRVSKEEDIIDTDGNCVTGTRKDAFRDIETARDGRDKGRINTRNADSGDEISRLCVGMRD